MLQPIDAVITWVDGSDPKLIEKQRKYFSVIQKDESTHSTRFADNNEIFFCISSIIINAPFVNNIYIVTDNQRPRTALKKLQDLFGSNTLSKIKIVDHAEIFRGYEDFLPTFNSISIETMLHRIPNISENYIYFNDDVILGRLTQPEDFFLNDRPVLRGKWRKSKEVLRKKLKNMRILSGQSDIDSKIFNFKSCQLNSFRLIHAESPPVFFWHDHTPHAFSRKTMEDFFYGHQGAIERNISFKVRHFSQFDPMSISNAIELIKGDVKTSRTSLTYLKPSSKTFQKLYVSRKMISFRALENKFICLQSMDAVSYDVKDFAFGWLEKILKETQYT